MRLNDQYYQNVGWYLKMDAKDITPTKSKQPGIPRATNFSSNSITLMWDKPEYAECKRQYYVLQYRDKGGKRWVTKETPDSNNVFIVTGLKSDSCYEFRVRAIFDEGNEGPYSEINSNIRTKQWIPNSFGYNATKITNDQPAIYQLTTNEDTNSVNSKAKSRRCTFGNEHGCHVNEKTIILVGETGSGKSTLIEGIANYLLGVEWEDDYRLSIIDLKDEEKKPKNDQSQSQTEWITCYTIPSRRSEIRYTLNIIDTPGFGDTRGIVRDKAITDQIKLFFETPPPKGISALDAVCFVTQAPMPRLTQIQRYIFDSVLSVFGKDISENIFVLVTFADLNEPPVIKAIEAANVPFQRAFRFNNSALFFSAKDNAELSFSQMYWNMGKENFNVFFTELEETETRSLQLTREVLDARKRLDSAIRELQPKIRECLCRIATIKEENRVIEKHKLDIIEYNESDSDFLETSAREIQMCSGEDQSSSAKSTLKSKFRTLVVSVINVLRANKEHSSSKHANDPCRSGLNLSKDKKTSEELKTKYALAKDKKAEYSTYLQEVKERFNREVNIFSNLIQQILKDINELKQKSLEYNTLRQLDYIEKLIKVEELEHINGWQTRVEFLKKFEKQMQEGALESLQQEFLNVED